MKNNSKKQLEYMNNVIYSQLSYAEAKNAILSGLVGSALFALIGVIIDINDFGLQWLQIILGVMALSLLITLIVSLTSFYPNTKTFNDKEENMFYYGDIAKQRRVEEYLEKTRDPNKNLIQLAGQNIILSNMILRKHKIFVITLKLFIASIILPYYIVLLIKIL